MYILWELLQISLYMYCGNYYRVKGRGQGWGSCGSSAAPGSSGLMCFRPTTGCCIYHHNFYNDLSLLKPLIQSLPLWLNMIPSNYRFLYCFSTFGIYFLCVKLFMLPPCIYSLSTCFDLTNS